MEKCLKSGLCALLLLLWACGRQESNQNQKLTGKAFELELTDSLVVDYIGLLSWSHISPDGQKFLAMDHQRSEIILID